MNKDKIAEAIGNVDEKYVNEAVGYKAKKRKITPAFVGFAAMAACFVLVLGIGALKKDSPATPGDSPVVESPTEAVALAETIDSVVCIDINPSIELTVSKNDKVLTAVALNEDAEIVLEGMNLAGVDLNTALNAIMGALLKHGYLDEVYNAINVCVENDDEERASELGELVTSEISSIFDEEDLIGGVNTQLCSNNDETKRLAESYGISVGKLILAQEVSANMGLSLEVAVTFSISELWDLLDAESVTLLTKEEVLKIALADAKVEAADVTLTSEKIQETAGVFTYTVKFTAGESKEYEYKINAVDGAVITCEFKYVVKEDTSAGTSAVTPSAIATPTPSVIPEVTVTPEGTPTAAPTATQAPTPVPTEKPVKEITKKEALAIAYADAGVEEKEAKLTKLVYMPKEKEYRIEFSVGMTDYVYRINAVEGSVVQKETVDNTSTEETEEDLPVISVDEALALALEKAGVELSDLTKCDIKYTNKKACVEYKIHFHVGKDRYEYVVDAVTGEITEQTHPMPGVAEKPQEKEEHVTPEGPEIEEKPGKHEKPMGPEDSKITIDVEGETEPTVTVAPAPEEPLKPHEKGEKPHEREDGDMHTPGMQVGPQAGKEQNVKGVGKEDSKVTISFEEGRN
ncbi:MAG: PepSY domain-containing protein [Lachnospiraceae bacterium]|nr:PepSY domain-containing protein [Lachnospiraceae bacterium]